MKDTLCHTFYLTLSWITHSGGSKQPCEEGYMERIWDLLPTASEELRLPTNSYEWTVLQMVPPALLKPSDYNSPSQQPECNLMRHRARRAQQSHCQIPNFQELGTKINVCCFKLLNLRAICYTAMTTNKVCFSIYCKFLWIMCTSFKIIERTKCHFKTLNIVCQCNPDADF